jgi:hypothetical protein
MNKHYLGLASLTIVAAALLISGPHAYADDANQFNQAVQTVRADRAQLESQLGIDPQLDTYPRATSYYDDLEDHYEQGQLVRDDIDRGIPPGSWWAPLSA